MAAPTIGSDQRRRSATVLSSVQLVFERSPATATLVIILAFLAFRLALSLSVGLGVDESYSLANARDLSLSYFDHPPLHLWIAHVSEELFGAAPLARLPFLLMFAGTTWMMFRFTERLFSSPAGVWAALAVNLSGFFTVAAGEWILPDGPLLLCLSGAGMCFARILKPLDGDGTSLRNWAMFGRECMLPVCYDITAFLSCVSRPTASFASAQRLVIFQRKWNWRAAGVRWLTLSTGEPDRRASCPPPRAGSSRPCHILLNGV